MDVTGLLTRHISHVHALERKKTKKWDEIEERKKKSEEAHQKEQAIVCSVGQTINHLLALKVVIAIPSFFVSFIFLLFFSRGQATIELAVLVGRLVGRSICPSVHDKNKMWAFFRYSTPARDGGGMYMAFFVAAPSLLPTL